MIATIPGNIFLSTGDAWDDKLIKVGQAIRHSKQASKWCHAGIFVDDHGGTIEALAHGVVRNTRDPADVLVIDPTVLCPTIDRAKVVAFATAQLGDSYDYLQDIWMGVDCLTGWHLHNHPGGSWICSEITAAALAAGGWTPTVPVDETLPSDLYVAFRQTA